MAKWVFEEDMICKRDECYYVAAIPGDWQFMAVFCKIINSIETGGGGPFNRQRFDRVIHWPRVGGNYLNKI